MLLYLLQKNTTYTLITTNSSVFALGFMMLAYWSKAQTGNNKQKKQANMQHVFFTELTKPYMHFELILHTHNKQNKTI